MTIEKMRKSPYNSVVDSLEAMGIVCVPLFPNTQIPLKGVKLKEYRTRKPMGTQINVWKSVPDANVAIMLGGASNVVAVDIDHATKEEKKLIIDNLPKSFYSKVGSKGVTFFYKMSKDFKNKKLIKDGRVIVEFLGDGCLTTIPPSIHPKTKKPYTWGDAGMIDVNNLRELQYKDIKLIEKALGLERKEPAVKNSVEFKTTSEDVKEAIDFISPDISYHEWIQIGMAVKSHLGESGFDIWNDWSSKGEKYTNKKDVRDKWNSFRRDEVQIGTLMMYARDSGYINIPDKNELSEFAHSTRQFSVKDDTKEKKAIGDKFPYSVFKSDNAVVRIAEWAYKNSYRPQPVLCYGSALSAVACLKGQRVKTQTNARTNLYCLAIAPSGAGKNDPMKAIQSLFFHAGADNYLGGMPASGAGLLTAIKNNGGVRLLQLDEVGKFFLGITQSSAPKYLLEIVDYMTQLFSSAGSVFLGKEYANHDGKMDRTDIIQPSLSIFGATVPERFFEALSSSFSNDGFLPRWLVFESKTLFPEKNNEVDISNPPEYLRRDVQAILRTQKAEGFRKDAIVIPFTPKAQKIYDDYCDLIEKRALDEYNSTGTTNPFIIRSAEHVQKVALTLQEGSVMDVRDVEDAIAIVEYSQDKMISNIKEHMADSKKEGDVKKVLSVCSKFNGEFTLSDVTAKTRQFKKRERNEIIEELVETGNLEVRVDKTAGRNKNVFKFITF